MVVREVGELALSANRMLILNRYRRLGKRTSKHQEIFTNVRKAFIASGALDAASENIIDRILRLGCDVGPEWNLWGYNTVNYYRAS